MRLGVFVIPLLSSDVIARPMFLGESHFLANIQETLAHNTNIIKEIYKENLLLMLSLTTVSHSVDRIILFLIF